MFSGIVQHCCPVAALDTQPGYTRLGLRLPDHLSTGLNQGASVAISGVCLTVSGLENGLMWFDAVSATLGITNLGALEPGSLVNIERSLVWGAEVGGHPISGHVTATASVIDLNSTSRANYLDFIVPDEWRRYVFLRGYIALNGCSLTVAEEDDMGIYRINLIPETLRQTNFAACKPGDRLNFEIDHQTMVLVDTIERRLKR